MRKKTMTFALRKEALDALRELKNRFGVSQSHILEKGIAHMCRPSVGRRLFGEPREVERTQ